MKLVLVDERYKIGMQSYYTTAPLHPFHIILRALVHKQLARQQILFSDHGQIYTEPNTKVQL